MDQIIENGLAQLGAIWILVAWLMVIVVTWYRHVIRTEKEHREERERAEAEYKKEREAMMLTHRAERDKWQATDATRLLMYQESTNSNTQAVNELGKVISNLNVILQSQMKK